MTDSGGDMSIPASIAAAWGLTDRPSKGPKPGLSLQRVVQAGIAVADAEGLGAVSMARVAKELGTATMSLYRYVAAKDELLLLMVDAAYGPPPTDVITDWRKGLSNWAWAELKAFRRHPWGVRVPISGPPITPNELAWFERGLALLRGTPLTATEKPSVILLVSGYVRNVATVEADLREAFEAANLSPDDALNGYNRLVLSLTTPEAFPEVHAVVNAGTFDAADDPDDEFTFGLERILDGLDALITSRTTDG
jgi:AcrR family transcriptional regulator